MIPQQARVAVSPLAVQVCVPLRVAWRCTKARSRLLPAENGNLSHTIVPRQVASRICASAGALAIALGLQRGSPIRHTAAKGLKGNLMLHFNTDLYAIVFSVVIAFAFLSAAAAAPKLSEADDTAIKSAIASCKAEAKAKKIGFISRRAFLRDCVTETIRNNPPKR
jgi:hypothetical protein